MKRFEVSNMLGVEEGDQIFFEIDSIEKRYSINKFGLVHDFKTNRFLTPFSVEINNKKYLFTYLYINNKRERIITSRLLLMAFSPLHISLEKYKTLDIIYYDKDLSNLSLDNIIWKLPKNGIESDIKKGFYSIIGNPDLLVNKDYIFINAFSFKQYKITYRDKDSNKYYPSVDCKSQYEFDLPLQTTMVHRLIALAFIPLPDDIKNPIINHKDGIKSNYDKDNLEWVTYSQNRIHAVKNRLCVQSKVVECVDCRDGKRRVFSSLQEASRFTNIHAWDIKRSIDIYIKTNKILCYPWIFTYEGGHLPRTFARAEKNSLGVKYYKVEKGNEVKYIRGNRNLMSYVGSKNVMDNIQDKFTFRDFNISIVNEIDVPEDIIKEIKSPWFNHGGKKQKQIRVTDLSSGQVTEYANTDEFATLVGAKRKTIQKYLGVNNGVWHNFKIEYLN